MPDRYQEPAKGSEDWDVPLNNNFSALDIDVEVREARAPDAAQESPDDGAMFMDTRSGDIYLADGSSWGDPVWTLDNIGTGDGTGDVSGTDIQPSSIADYETNAPIEGHIIESFDGGFGHYLGDTGVYSIVAGDIAGANMLEFSDTSGNTQVIWTEEVETRRGESYAAYMRPAGSTSPTLIVCGQLDSNSNLHAGYGVYLSPSRGEVRLIKEPTTSDDGWFSTTLDTASATLSGGTLYRVELDLGFDTIQARVYDESETTVATLSGVDGEFNSGVLGWRDASGTTGTSNYDMVTRSAIRARGGSGGSGTAGIGDHYAATGDGTTQVFQWDTGVVDASDINYVTIDASTSAASADYERFIDGTAVGVRYAEPPADGDQLGWYWSVNASVETVDAEADAYDGSGTFLGSYTELQTGTNLLGSVSNGRLTLDSEGNAYDGTGTLIGSYTELQAGDNLTGSITDGRFTLDAAGGTSDGGHSVDDDGAEVYADVSRVNFGTDLGVNDDGNNEVTVNSTASSTSGGSHNWIDVTSGTYGADNTGGNDASGAIQQACDDAGAGTVFIPGGTYLCTGEITLTSAHNGLSLVGEGYGSHLQGDNTNNTTLMIRDSGTPLRNISVSTLRLSNADYANIHAHWESHDDSRGISFQNLWSHNSGRGVLLGTTDSWADGIRVWNTSHNGFSFTGSDNDPDSGDQYSHSDETWPTDIQRRWVNNIVSWNCQSNGIDLSKQACLCTNFVSRHNYSGMKFSNWTTGGSMLANGWLIENDGDGMRDTTGGDYNNTIFLDRVVALRNGQDPNVEDGIYGNGKGFNFRNASFQVGSIYAGGNIEHGVNFDGCEAAVHSIVTENNGNAGVRGTTGNAVDIFHLAGNGNGGGLTTGTGFGDGGVWVARSRDYGGSQH